MQETDLSITGSDQEQPIVEPTRYEIRDYDLKRLKGRIDFEKTVKPVFDRLDRWRRESAAGKVRQRELQPLKAAA